MKLEIIFAATILGMVCAISIPSAVYNHNKNVLIEKAISSGKPPLEIMCALDNAMEETCRDLIAKR